MVKKKDLKPEQARIIRRKGLDPRFYDVVMDLPNSMIIRHVVTKEAKVLEKSAKSYAIPN